ncbi:MAG: Do family serine endopeptidase [Alphaproteobacteria bacterium]|nr:Do family serine endopeptidase [Alphaproteobacteria bacterium]
MLNRVRRPALLLAAAIALLAPAGVQASEPPRDFSDMAKKMLPAVVNISTTQKIPAEPGTSPDARDGAQDDAAPGEAPTDEFLRQFFKDNPEAVPAPETSALGSGFIIDPEGYVVTNNHVIDAAKEIKLILADGREFKAKRVGSDAATDLALLKVDAKEPLPYLHWGSSEKMEIGDWVVAIGNPFGLGGSITAGLLSGRARDIQAGPYDDFLQTDAAINRGHSGGPLFDAEGNVIGVNTAILSPNGGSIGIAFAIPASTAKPIIAQLRESGSVRRGQLGVQIQPVTDEIAKAIGLENTQGALVAAITKGSPAEKAGLEPGDVILRYDGHPIETMRTLPRQVANTTIGKTVDVTVWRDGRNVDRDVTIGEQTPADVANAPDEGKKAPAIEENPTLGMRLQPLDESLKQRLGLEKNASGVLVTSVKPESAAAAQGIEAGDIISEVNRKPVSSPRHVEERVTEVKKQGRPAALLRINRSGAYRFIALPV